MQTYERLQTIQSESFSLGRLHRDLFVCVLFVFLEILATGYRTLLSTSIVFILDSYFALFRTSALLGLLTAYFDRSLSLLRFNFSFYLLDHTVNKAKKIKPPHLASPS